MKENRAVILEEVARLTEVYEAFRGSTYVIINGEKREVLVSLADVEGCFYLIAVERKTDKGASSKKKEEQQA